LKKENAGIENVKAVNRCFSVIECAIFKKMKEDKKGFLKKVVDIVMLSMFVLGLFLMCFLSNKASHGNPKESAEAAITKELSYDPLYSKQWYLQDSVKNVVVPSNPTDDPDFIMEDIILNSTINIGVDDFWKCYQEDNGKELVIAILDSCVDIHHEDLESAIWKNEAEIPDNGIDDDHNGYIDDFYGWNFFSDSPAVYDDGEEAAHGTHCAGILAAAHNGVGTMGILGNTNVKLMVVPIYGGEELEADDLVSAIRYADDMGADICNISCVFQDGGDKISKAMDQSDMYFVVASGNFQSQYINGLNLEEYRRFPACCKNKRVITVGSINERSKWSHFSNYSPAFVDIAAPGEYIYSTLPGDGYGFESGTSASAPIVTGILSAYYYCYADTVEEAAELLLSNAQPNMGLMEKASQGRIVRFLQKH